MKKEMKRVTTTKLYCGIDISNETIDICYQNEDQIFINDKLKNDTDGFKQLWKLLGKRYHFVMETTGVYHLPLCFYLHSKNANYSVVPALQIKRFIQMNLERNKSDKKDAQYICKYGMSQNPEQYEMPDQLYFECKALNNAIEGVTQEITVFKNKLHAIKKLNLKDKTVAKVYQNLIIELQLQLKKLEDQLNKKLLEWQPELVKLVSSIPGIGKRSTSILIVSTQGFKYTNNYKQLISFAGLSPKEFSSGTSIKSKVKICKMGGGRLRHVLYMGALNAKENNPACKELFDRLVAKGKNKKLAVIAVCNKLLKQVFGVVKNQEPFNKNYFREIA
jgi:transposase